MNRMTARSPLLIVSIVDIVVGDPGNEESQPAILRFEYRDADTRRTVIPG